MKNKYLILMAALLLLICLTGSEDDKDMGQSRAEILIIAPKLELSGTMPPTPDKVSVMVATKENSDTKYYLHLGRIEGFEYVEGYEYKIKVLITMIENPPMDGHLEDFKLIEIISKKAQAE